MSNALVPPLIEASFIEAAKLLTMVLVAEGVSATVAVKTLPD